MILIDKSKDVQVIVLTLSELTDDVYPQYILNFKSDSNRKEYSIVLPANTSEFKSRYDLFRVPSFEFTEMNTGFYTYSVLFDEKVIETGKALIKDIEYSTIISPETDSDKILIYGE